MKITKKSNNKKNLNYSNIEYKNIDDINNKIKDIDYKINKINFNIKKNENDIKNIINDKEKILNENQNNKSNISVEDIKYEFSNINKRLDEIIKIINNEIKNDNKYKKEEIIKIKKENLDGRKEVFNDNTPKNVIVYQDNICISPSVDKTKIPILIDDFFILGKFKEKNKIQKIEEFELIKKEKNINIKTKNYKFKNFPLIKKNVIYQIKRVEAFEIQKSNSNKKNINYFYENKRLSIIKKPLSHQLISQIYIPGINYHEENIQKAEENELLRIYIPIPEFVIEGINDFVLYALKKNPLLIQYNSQIEFKPKK